MTTVVEMKGICKVYENGVVANDNVDFEIRKGEIHALIGENGAGKSTLMSILYGMTNPDRGEILIHGKACHFGSPRDAIRSGIGMIHQHFMLIPSFTTAQNVVLGFEPEKGLFLDEKAATDITEKLSEQYGLKVDARALTSQMSVGMQQRVEILKLLYQGADILIFDEPTAVLTPQETNDLFASVRQLIHLGKTIIFITHKLNEVQEIADRFTVMRRGKRVATENAKAVSKEAMANLMVGRDVILKTRKSPAVPKELILSVERLSFRDEHGVERLKNLSFSIRAGEILGLAGVEGNGQTELVEILSGLMAATSGSVKIGGKEILGFGPRKIRVEGVAHIPENRSHNGFAADMTIEDNLIVDRYWRPPFSKYQSLQTKTIARHAQEQIKQFDIRVQNGKQWVGQCSGGNIQKVIVARELSAAATLLIAAQPTRGVDVGATEYIRDLIVKQRLEGKAVLLVSADLTEVLNLSDRVMTMFEGEITGIFSNEPTMTEAEVGHYMLGIKRGQGERADEKSIG